MRKLFNLVFVLFCLLALFACGEVEEDNGDGYKGGITIALPVGFNNQDVFTAAISRYNELRPNVKINISWQTGENDFYQTYNQSITDGNAPDCTFIDHVYIQTLASKNRIIPVTDTINEVYNSYVDNLVEVGKYNDDYYAFPFSANTICLFYNKDILGSRSVPTTYSEFITVAEDIKKQENLKPEGQRASVFSLFTSSDCSSFGAFLFNSWVKREGGQIISDDFKTATFNTTSVSNVFKKWQEIGINGYGNQYASTEGLFYTGRVAFIEMGCWKIPDLFGENKMGNFGVAPLFSLNESNDNSSVLGLYSLCVTNSKDENKKKLALDFCKFLSSDTEVQTAYAKHTNLLPVTKEACNDEYFSSDEWQVFINAMSPAATRPGSPAWPKIQSTIEKVIVSIMTNNAKLDNALPTANSNIQNSLNQYNR